MFSDLEAFVAEREDHFRRLNDLNTCNFDPNIRNEKLKEEDERYKNSIRKYLSTSISTVNEVFPFSLYKVGKDMDAKFHVIETKIRKGKAEIYSEFMANQNLGNNLSPRKRRNLEIAMQVIFDYSDDIIADRAREAYLNGGK